MPAQVALQVLSGFTMFSVIGPGLFGLGIGFAMERQHGIVTLKRAQPMPFAANLIGKLFSAMTMALIVITLLLTIATTFGHVELTAAQAARTALVGVLGVLPFSALGLLIGSLGFGQRLAGRREPDLLPDDLSVRALPVPDAEGAADRGDDLARVSPESAVAGCARPADEAESVDVGGGADRVHGTVHLSRRASPDARGLNAERLSRGGSSGLWQRAPGP